MATTTFEPPQSLLQKLQNKKQIYKTHGFRFRNHRRSQFPRPHILQLSLLRGLRIATTALLRNGPIITKGGFGCKFQSAFVA